MVLVVIKGILPKLQPVVVSPEIESRRVAVGQIDADPVPFSKEVAGRPDLDVVSVDPACLNRRRISVGIIGLGGPGTTARPSRGETP
jgi:hypothetical protein